jgi:hypothetical protein
MLCVGNRVTDDLVGGVSHTVLAMKRINAHIFEEDLENTTGFFIDEAGDTLDTTTTSEAANGGLGDTWRNSKCQEDRRPTERMTHPGCCHEGFCDDA